jgi:cell division protein FtsZ
VESTPTYKRTREILDSINSQATGDYVHEEPVASTPDEPVQGTIKFFS